MSTRIVTCVVTAATASVIIASVAKQLGAWCGWFRDANRLAVVGGLSLANLLIVCCLSCALAYRLRRDENNTQRDWIVWLLIGGGCFFLFVDSTLGINEWLETTFEQLAGLSSTGWTHRIDDGLIALAGLVGIGAAIYWRDALLRCRKSAQLYCAAILLLCAMMLLDLSTDSLDRVTPEFGSMGFTKLTRGAIELGEDVLMLIGQALLVVATFTAFQAAGRRPNA